MLFLMDLLFSAHLVAFSLFMTCNCSLLSPPLYTRILYTKEKHKIELCKIDLYKVIIYLTDSCFIFCSYPDNIVIVNSINHDDCVVKI